MASYIIEGGHPLCGEITPQGAKNEALQIICATLLTQEEVNIKNIPNILDVNNLIQLLRDIGVTITRTTNRNCHVSAINTIRLSTKNKCCSRTITSKCISNFTSS